MKGMLCYDDQVPFQSLVEKSGSIFGIVYGINEDGVFWLEKLLQKNKQLRCNLIVAVYPACLTKLPTLKGLLHIQSCYKEDRVAFRILTTDCQVGAPSNTLCFISSDGLETYYSVGATPNFGLIPLGIGQVNFVFTGDAILLEAWRNWFDLAWAETAQLNTKTIQIPSLVPAAGTKEATEMWRDYVDQCKKYMISQHAAEVTSDKVAINVETGEVTLQSSNGEKKQTLTEQLKVPRLDSLAERISRIYDKGSQVNFSKVGRIPPLDAPIKPEWFGVETLRQVGSISRETKYRISVLDAKTLRSLENRKQAGPRILRQLSYSLGDNQHWIPHKAIPLFEKELQRVNDEGIKEVYKALNGQPDDFVDTQIDRIVKDANAMYRDFYPSKTLPATVIDEILNNLKDRLNRASSNKFMPEVSYNSIGFHYQKHSDWVAQWDQPLFLLIQIAEFPRKTVTDSFFLRGLRLNVNELLEAMNVCDDYIVKENQKTNIQEKAREELHIIRDIKDSDTDSRKKCEDILALMEGKFFNKEKK